MYTRLKSQNTRNTHLVRGEKRPVELRPPVDREPGARDLHPRPDVLAHQRQLLGEYLREQHRDHSLPLLLQLGDLKSENQSQFKTFERERHMQRLKQNLTEKFVH